MPTPDLLSSNFWVEAVGYWAGDSERLYRLALITAGLIGIPLLAIRTFAANRSANASLEQAKTATLRHAEQTSADRERRITESFAKAGEHLGSDKLETRLVGIYTLERIARESEREYWPIMETLTAFVREHAPLPPRQALADPFVDQSSSADETPGESAPAERLGNAAERASVKVRPATDIQAILTVFGRRDEKARKQDQVANRCLNLAMTDLRGAHLAGAHLEDAIFVRAHLEGAYLAGARLDHALFAGAHLEGADLAGAHLEHAFLWKAHLEGADLTGAHLEHAHFDGAVALTQQQLEKASGDDRTDLPADLTRPAHWSKATPDAPNNAE